MTQTGTSRLAGGAIYHVLGVPYRTGSLTPGSEHDAQPYRDTGFVAQLQVAGCEAIDGGDIPLPSYLPHHEVPPIRNWPGPRIAWEILSDRLVPILDQPGHVPLLIGGDCSIVVGATQALMKSAGLDRVHCCTSTATAMTGSLIQRKARARHISPCGWRCTANPFGRVLGFHLLKSRSSARRGIVNLEPRACSSAGLDGRGSPGRSAHDCTADTRRVAIIRVSGAPPGCRCIRRPRAAGRLFPP